MAPALDKLLQALRAVDEAEEERVVHAGDYLIWGLRGQTRHPSLAAAFPSGLLLVTERGDPCDDGGDIGQIIDACRSPCPKASDGYVEPPCPVYCSAPPNAQRGRPWLGPETDFERTLCEDRLVALPLSAARRVVSEISRTRLRLSLPLLIAAKGRPEERHAWVTYFGARTPGGQQDENRPPIACGLGIVETINIFRPPLPVAATVGDALRHCQGASRSSEVRFRMRYDLSAATDSAALKLQLPAELLPGSFISLVVSWPMSLQQAASLPLLQQPSTLSCSSVIYLRCGHRPEAAPLGRYLLDLQVLHSLAQPDAASRRLQGGDGDVAMGAEAEGVEAQAAEAQAAVARFVEKERRLATCPVAAGAEGEDGTAAPAASELVRSEEDEERPDRDFVDRLWLDVLAHCETAASLAAAVDAVLDALGSHGGIAPSVRRDNGTQLAELVRQALRLSTLRQYAALSQAEQLREATRAWEEGRTRFARVEGAIQLAIEAGIECLRRDFLHHITRRGFVSAQDLSEYADQGADVAVQLDALRGLRHIAELALLSARHRLWMDTMRRLVLKAAEYYRLPEHAAGTSLPIFAVPLSGAALGRLLAGLPVLEPAAFALECSSTSVQARRAPASAAAEDGEERATQAGIWRPPQAGGLFEYHLTVVDRFGFAK